MPFHKSYPNLSEIIFWQDIWFFLQRFGIKPLPLEYKSCSDISKMDNYYIVDINGFAKQKINSFQDALEVITTLINYLKTKKEYKILGEWNFFGKPEDKEKYTKYLYSLIWQNQDSEDLTKLHNYQQILLNPLLMMQHSLEVPFYVPTPSEFFDKSANDLLQKIESTLTTLQYNPYLSQGYSGTFEWQIQINNFKISGYISKEKNNLTHTIHFTPEFGNYLTEHLK